MANYDSKERETLLVRVFEGGRDYLLTLKDSEAEETLDMMQTELREPTGTFKAGRVVKAMETLARHSGKFPSKYWLKDVKVGDTVAYGGSGDIYEGDWHGTSVAVKFARYCQPKGRRNAAENARWHKAFCHEVFQWHRLSHPNILPFLGLYQELEGPRVGMVSNWQSNGDLKDYLEHCPEADSSQLIQATDGLTYLHEQEPSVVHMDIKPGNILISDTGTAMLADFGYSRMKHDLTSGWSSTVNGYTERYVSPEVARGNNINEITVSSDIWSLGMVVFRVFTGKEPYEEYRSPWEKIRDATPPQKPPFEMTHTGQGFTEDLWIFLERSCWAKAENRRPRARDCSERLQKLKSRWLSDKRTISEICMPVTPTYAQNRRNLCSKMERFDIKLEVYEDFKKLKLQGKEANVRAAEDEIHRDVESLRNVVKETLPVPTRFYGRLIGEGGKLKKATEQEHSVKIQFFDSKGTVEIQGTPQNVSAAMEELKSKLDHLDSREISVTNDVSNLVKNNRMEILSKLGLQKLTSISDTVIYMEGPEKALNDGQTYIRELGEYLEREGIEPIEGDARLLKQIFDKGSWSKLATECGGPSDPVLQRRLFIKPLAESDRYYLRAAPNVLQTLRSKLELEVERRRKRVIGVKIPQDLHKSLLRDYQINNIQRTTSTSIFFPHNERYHEFDSENDLDLTGDPKNIVKILGTPQSCDLARKELKKLVKQECQLRDEIPVSSRLHHNVYKLVLRELKNNDIQITPRPLQPLPPLDEIYPPPPPPMGTEPLWERYNIYRNENVTPQECTWLLRANTKTDLERGIKIVEDVVQQEMHRSWKGLLTFDSNATFGSIVGKAGETVQRLQEQTSTRIDVPKAGQGTTVVIFGPRRGVDEAKDLIKQRTSRWKAVSNE